MKIKFDIMLDDKVLNKGCTFEKEDTDNIGVIIMFATRWATKQYSYKNLNIDNISIVKGIKPKKIIKTAFTIKATDAKAKKNLFVPAYFIDEAEARKYMAEKYPTFEIKKIGAGDTKEFIVKEGK